jgi:hypothetical protein
MPVSSFNSLLYALYTANSRKAAVYAFSRSEDGDFDIMACNNTVEIAGYRGKAAEIAIPEKINDLPVVAIGASAFKGKHLTHLTIPNGVTAIGDRAFADNQLTSITILNGITAIGRWAFWQNQLTSVTIPDSVTVIEKYAFLSNPLTSVTIGANVDVAADPFPGDLEKVYTSGGSRAGTYISGDGGKTWTRQ